MKWYSILFVIALAFFANACEKHPVSDAPEEGVTAFGPHSKSAEEKAEAKPGAEAAAPAPTETAPAPAEAKPGEAPKFFPEEKAK